MELKTRNTGNKKKHWVYDEFKEAVSKRNEAKIKMLQNITPEITVEKQLKKAIDNKQKHRKEKKYIGGKSNVGKLR